MTVHLISGNFDISQGGINHLVNEVNTSLGAITSFVNLTGAVTSVGAVTSLGSFTSLQLRTALTDETGTGVAVFADGPTLTNPALGTPSALVGTNITGTAAALNIGGNAATATTSTTATAASTVSSANEATDTTCFPLFITASGTQTLQPKNNTGLVYNSNTNALAATTFTGALSGNATTATDTAAKTGTGSTYATSAGPTFTAPILGVATATSLNGNTITTGTGTLTLGASKVLTASNTLTLTGTDTTSINLTNAKIKTIGFSASSASLTTGQQGAFIVCPVAGTISGWNIVVDAGTATVAVWKIAAGTAKPTVANNINTSGVAISTGTAIESTTVSDFTSTTVTAGDIFAFNLSAMSGVTSIVFQLQITVT